MGTEEKEDEKKVDPPKGPVFKLFTGTILLPQ